MQHLIELLSVVRSRDRWVLLSASTRSDLTCWATFLEGWNGVSMMPRYSLPVITVESDASGSWGCGARWGPQWLQWQWQGAAQGWQIAPKELLPIPFAVAIWGHRWGGRLVHCRCDNMAVISFITILLSCTCCTAFSSWLHITTLLFKRLTYQAQITLPHIAALSTIDVLLSIFCPERSYINALAEPFC